VALLRTVRCTGIAAPAEMGQSDGGSLAALFAATPDVESVLWNHANKPVFPFASSSRIPIAAIGRSLLLVQFSRLVSDTRSPSNFSLETGSHLRFGRSFYPFVRLDFLVLI
jgi:hypothetical protein